MISAAEHAEIYATVERELPRIEKLVNEAATQLASLSDVSQKQAVAKLVVAFVLSVYPDYEEGALTLSGAMREQVDIYLREIFSTPSEH